jgi:aerobic-type carbon monoxide dehydrogenase small subunit (CoxS/CutS family)
MAARACVIPAQGVAGRDITTLEGLSKDGAGALHPVQQAFLEVQAPQCGWCQSGQMMAAAALLAANPSPSDDEIMATMTANYCRCGTYGRIRRAVARAAELARAQRASS